MRITWRCRRPRPAYARDRGECSLTTTRPRNPDNRAARGAMTVNGHIAASNTSGGDCRRYLINGNNTLRTRFECRSTTFEQSGKRSSRWPSARRSTKSTRMSQLIHSLARFRCKCSAPPGCRLGSRMAMRLVAPVFVIRSSLCIDVDGEHTIGKCPIDVCNYDDIFRKNCRVAITWPL